MPPEASSGSGHHGYLGHLVADAPNRGRLADGRGSLRSALSDGSSSAGATSSVPWLFTTVLRSHIEHGSLPWSHAALSGFIVDPDRKKMSKSKGNVVTPMGVLEQFGSDGVRYWAASARPGGDAAFDPNDPGQIKVGRRLAIKILNAARFALLQSEPRGPISEPLDRGMLTDLSVLIGEVTELFGV